MNLLLGYIISGIGFFLLGIGMLNSSLLKNNRHICFQCPYFNVRSLINRKIIMGFIIAILGTMILLIGYIKEINIRQNININNPSITNKK